MCEGALASSEECAVLAKLNSLLRVEFDRNAQKSAPSSVIVAELEREKKDHSATSKRLLNVTEKLRLALHEIDRLSERSRQDRQQFQTDYEALKRAAHTQTSRSEDLEMELQRVNASLATVQETLALRNAEVRELKCRLKKQKEDHKKELDETALRAKQESFMRSHSHSSHRHGHHH